MPFGLGMGELIVILVIVLLIFGAGKLPQIGDAFGRAIRNFRATASGDNQIEVSKQKEIAGGPAADDESPAVDEAEVASGKVAEKKR
jgi:sec-independent protein translocase protein TatA